LRPMANREFRGTSRYDELRGGTIAGYAVGSALVAVSAGLFVWEFGRDAVDSRDLISVGSTGQDLLISASARF